MSLAPLRNSGPLGQLQLDADKLKTKVNEVVAISKKLTSKNFDDPQIQTYHANCIECLDETDILLKQAKGLQLENEQPKLPPNFEDKKNDEIKRLEGFQERLKNVMDTINEIQNVEKSKPEIYEENPTIPEKDLTIENITQENGISNNKSGDDEGEYTDLYIAIQEYAAEQDGDLSLARNEIVDIITKEENGWWVAENEKGARGLVPSNFLRECTEEDEDLAFDDLKYSPDVSKERSSVAAHVTFDPSVAEYEEVRRSSQETPPPSPNSEPADNIGKKLWGDVKKSLAAPTKVDVTEVLAAMGALPAGFRPSTLHNLQANTNKYSLKAALSPQRSSSNLTFTDLLWDPRTSSISQRLTRILRTCNLWKCTQIPLPGTGVEVLSRHVRFALFDGEKVVSNIVTVRATVQPNRPKYWQFSSPRFKDGGLLPSLLHGNSIVRSDNLHTNIGILFELAVTYIRSPPKRVVQYSDGVACEYGDDEDDDDDEARKIIRQTGERGEMSCGWCQLKLFDPLGSKIPNRTYELSLCGGTPYEVGVAVDPSIERRAQGSRLRMLLAANKQPKLFVQIGDLSAAERKPAVFLPKNILLPASYLTLTWLFRCVLVESVVCNRKSEFDASIIHSPVVSTFLEVVNQPDVMDAIKRNWFEKEKLLSRGEKKDQQFLTAMFKSVVMESGFPFLTTKTLPKESWAETQIELARVRFITQTSATLKQENGVLNYFLTTNTDMRPFDISELTFDPSCEVTEW